MLVTNFDLARQVDLNTYNLKHCHNYIHDCDGEEFLIHTHTQYKKKKKAQKFTEGNRTHRLMAHQQVT